VVWVFQMAILLAHVCKTSLVGRVSPNSCPQDLTYGAFLSHGGTPFSSKSLDHDLVLKHNIETLWFGGSPTLGNLHPSHPHQAEQRDPGVRPRCQCRPGQKIVVLKNPNLKNDQLGK
jgi:hypothetical protein